MPIHLHKMLLKNQRTYSFSTNFYWKILQSAKIVNLFKQNIFHKQNPPRSSKTIRTDSSIRGKSLTDYSPASSSRETCSKHLTRLFAGDSIHKEVLHEHLRISRSRRTIFLVVCNLKIIDLGSCGKWLANLRSLACNKKLPRQAYQNRLFRQRSRLGRELLCPPQYTLPCSTYWELFHGLTFWPRLFAERNWETSDCGYPYWGYSRILEVIFPVPVTAILGSASASLPYLALSYLILLQYPLWVLPVW